MRCFIAIEINKQTQKALGALQRELAGKVDIRKSDVKWVQPANIHITLKFLGDIKNEQSVDICKIAGQAAARHSRFDIEFKGLGCFGGRSARVVWVGTGKGSEQLGDLAADIDGALAQLGYPAERRKFAAHLTLCRVRNTEAGIKLGDAVKAYSEREVGIVGAESVSVFQSELTSSGPVYTLLANNGLK